MTYKNFLATQYKIDQIELHRCFTKHDLSEPVVS